MQDICKSRIVFCFDGSDYIGCVFFKYNMYLLFQIDLNKMYCFNMIINDDFAKWLTNIMIHMNLIKIIDNDD